MWALFATDWVFALGGLIFCLMGPLVIKALPQPKSGFWAVLTAPLNLLTQAGLSAVQKITSVFAPATFGPQREVGKALNETAQLVDDTAALLVTQASTTARLAQAVAGTLPSSELGKAIDKLNQRVGNAEKQAAGIGADVQPRINGAVQGIEAGVNTRIGSLDKQLERALHDTIPAIRSREAALEHGATHIWEWIRRHPLSLATGAFAGAVAVALGRLGMAWPKCENWKRIGKSVCGLPLGLIEGLLGDLIDILLIADVCQITKLMIQVAESTVVQDALRGIIDGVDELMICQGVDLPPALGGYWTGLPAAQPFSLLPAA